MAQSCACQLKDGQVCLPFSHPQYRQAVQRYFPFGPAFQALWMEAVQEATHTALRHVVVLYRKPERVLLREVYTGQIAQ